MSDGGGLLIMRSGAAAVGRRSVAVPNCRKGAPLTHGAFETKIIDYKNVYGKYELQLSYLAKKGSWVKGSVWFVLKFALPPFSPPLPCGVQISKQNMN